MDMTSHDALAAQLSVMQHMKQHRFVLAILAVAGVCVPQGCDGQEEPGNTCCSKFSSEANTIFCLRYLLLQECVYHKAVMDKKSPGTLARLAKQAGLMYTEVSSIFNQPSVVQHFERSWVAHTKMKVRSNLVKGSVKRVQAARCVASLLVQRVWAAAGLEVVVVLVWFFW
jgi:hypothetical protein